MKINSKIESITIGSFDGMHLAHQKLISMVDMMVVIERNSGYITDGIRRERYTSKPIAYCQFDKIKSLTPEEFVGRLKEYFSNLKKIVVGYDFYFGRNKSGSASSLINIFDGEVIVVKELTIDGVSIHSRTIKSLLLDGDIESANKLLGRRYSIDGQIHQGQGIGAKELVPTLNIYTKQYLIPKYGVYATRTLVDDRWLDSVSFFGHRVSTDDSFAIETHIIGKDIGSVDGNIEIEFVSRIRDNLKFDSLAELKSEIKSDIQKAKHILKSEENV